MVNAERSAAGGPPLPPLSAVQAELYAQAMRHAQARRSTELLKAQQAATGPNAPATAAPDGGRDTTAQLQLRLAEAQRARQAASDDAARWTATHDQLAAELLQAREVTEQLTAEQSRKFHEASFFDCGLCPCDEPHPIDDAVVLQCCRRRVCREMLGQYANAEIGNGKLPIPCPFRNDPPKKCAGALDDTLLHMVLEDAVFQRYHLLMMAKVQEMPGFVICRAPNCKGLVHRDDLGDPQTLSTATHHFVCTLNLAHQWCLECDVAWHANATCAQYQEWKKANAAADTAMGDLMKSQKWAKCPTCSQGVIREKDTCNAMMCRCGTKFCYLCQTITPKDQDGHLHFSYPSTPCYNKCFEGVYEL